MTVQMTEEVPVWLVERAYSDDEQNVLILKYATADGSYVYRKELALTSLEAADDPADTDEIVRRDDLMQVDDPETRAWYRSEVARVRGN